MLVVVGLRRWCAVSGATGRLLDAVIVAGAALAVRVLRIREQLSLDLSSLLLACRKSVPPTRSAPPVLLTAVSVGLVVSPLRLAGLRLAKGTVGGHKSRR